MGAATATLDAAAENRKFWDGIGKLPSQVTPRFWAAGATLSGFIGEPAEPRRLAIEQLKPPEGMPWWERIFYYQGQAAIQRAAAAQAMGEHVTEGAKWLWSALQGDFNKTPTTGQVIVGGIISMIPVIDQFCDLRDIAANCVLLSDEEARKDPENWLLLGMTCLGFVPVAGSAVKTIGKVALINDKLMPVLEVMTYIHNKWVELQTKVPWGKSPLEWLKTFDWASAARQAATKAKAAFKLAAEKTQAAIRWAIGPIKVRLEQLWATFVAIAARVEQALSDVANQITAKVRKLLKEKKTAGNYDGTAGTTNRHTQDQTPPPNRTDRDGPERDCRLRKYKDGCPGGKTPHHVVPDRAFKMPNNVYFTNHVKHADGYTICVTGGTPIRRGANVNEHGRVHTAYDGREAVLGAASTPKGVAQLYQLEALGVMAASQVTGCNAVLMAAELRAYHASKGLTPTMWFRADYSGATIRRVDPSSVSFETPPRALGVDSSPTPPAEGEIPGSEGDSGTGPI